MDQELNPDAHQLWLSAIQIIVHSEEFTVAFRIKKIQSKLEDHPLFYTWSKDLNIFEKALVISNEESESKETYISWVIEISWCIQLSPGIKPDWFRLSTLFSIKFCGQGQHWPSSMLTWSNQLSDNSEMLLRGV